jgi:foldase protein PrsA
MSDKPNEGSELNEKERKERELENEQEGYEDQPTDEVTEIEESDRTAGEAATAAAAVPAKNGGRGWMIASILLAVALIVVLIQPPFAGKQETVATVNGEKISKDELYDKLIALGGAQTLEGMINELVVQQAVAEAKVTATEEEIDEEIATITAMYDSREAFENELTTYGYTIEQLREQIGNQLAVEKIVSKDVNVTDDEVKQYFESNKASYDTPEQVRASHILVATKQEADTLLQQIQGGADFASLATENSLDTGSKELGGDLDFFPRGAMEQGFEEVAFGLQKGELGIAETGYGFHVIQVTDRQEAKTAALDDNQEAIRKQLEDQQIGELSSAWLTEVQAKAKIDNTLATDKQAAAEGASAGTGTVTGE